MALNSATLATDLLNNWLSVTAPDIATGATNFANQYDTYAMQALDFSGDSFNGGNKAGLISVLSAMPQSGTPAGAAAAFELAIQTYWIGATFQTLIPALGMASEVSSIITVPPITGIILTALTTVFSTTGGSASSQATAMANALHLGISSIVVTIIGVTSSPPPVPITILGPIS